MAPPKAIQPAKPPSANFDRFSIVLTRPSPPLIPSFSPEADASGNDAFTNGSPGTQTGSFEVVITELDAQNTPTGRQTKCLIFVPTGLGSSNKVHICWGPGAPRVEALTGAFRFAAQAAGWILIVVAGAEPGFTVLSAAEVVEMLRQVSRPTQIDALRLSAHSRGFRGLQQTLSRDLLVQRKGTATAPKVPASAVERVVNFDAFYFDFFRAMNASGIPSSKVFGYHVTIPLGGGPAPGQWSGAASQTVDLAPVIGGVRAILYSRVIQDAIRINKRPLVPPPGETLASITARLLTNLPPLGSFSSRSSPTDYRAFCKAQTTAIANCLKDEQNSNLDLALKGPLLQFVNDNRLAGFSIAHSANIWAHQLFACEFAHEVTDIADPKP